MASIVSIHSYRGGTGKSNLTANLATAVALTGKRVGVVDTDIQSPGIHVLFGLDDKQMTRAVNEETLMSVAISDWLILILRPDRQDYLGTAVTIEVSRKLGVPHLVLVVNKALASLDQTALRKDVERSFAVELGAVLLLTEDMLR